MTDFVIKNPRRRPPLADAGDAAFAMPVVTPATAVVVRDPSAPAPMDQQRKQDIRALNNALLDRIERSLWLDLPDGTRATRIAGAKAALTLAETTDPNEATLNALLVIAGGLAAQFAEMTMMPDQTLPWRDFGAKNTLKFMSVFAKLTETSGKIHSKGKQDITVTHLHKHVHVHADAADDAAPETGAINITPVIERRRGRGAKTASASLPAASEKLPKA